MNSEKSGGAPAGRCDQLVSKQGSRFSTGGARAVAKSAYFPISYIFPLFLICLNYLQNKFLPLIPNLDTQRNPFLLKDMFISFCPTINSNKLPLKIQSDWSFSQK